MKKLILVFFLGLFILLNLNACKNDKSSSLNTAVDIPKDEIVLNEYTKDDELSLNRGGRLVKYNDTIVYVGEATGHIFMQDLKSEKITEVSEDRPDSLYFDGKWVFYSLQGDKKGIYRLGLDGTVQKISEDYTLQICIYKNKLYYTKQKGYDSINGTPQGEFYKVDFDGQNKTKLLSSGVKNYFKIHNDWIYYTRLDNRSLNKAKLDGSMETLLAKGRTYIQLVTDNNVYYTDYNNGEALHKLNLNNSKNELIGAWARVLKCADKVYIQTRLFNENKIPEYDFSISMVDEEKDQVIKLLTLIDTGIDTYITVKGEWVYLANNNNTYRINLMDTSCKKEIVCKGYIYSTFGEYGYYFYNGDNLSDFNINRIRL